MAILFSGDFNADKNGEISSLTRNKLNKNYNDYLIDPEEFNLTLTRYKDIMYHIILGDASFMMPGSEKKDSATYFTLLRRDFPTLIVLGNKEPIYGKLDEIQEVDKGLGEKVYLIKEEEQYIAYLKRGKIYNIDDLKCLVLGGALTPEKSRIPGLWHAQEYWSKQEKEDLFNLLEKENNFDLVLSHTGPAFMNEYLFAEKPFYKDKSGDEVAVLNEEISKKIVFKEWWCSHWHQDTQCLVEKTKVYYRYISKTIAILSEENGKFYSFYDGIIGMKSEFFKY